MAAVAATGRFRAFSALRHRDFRLFFLNIGVQSFGQGIQFLGIGFLILDLSGEKTSLGLAVSLFGVSNLVFTFAGGVIADRVDRKLFLICCVFGNAVITIGLAILALTGLAQMWHVYTVVFILGGLMAVQMPARFALAADLVPREEMMNAVALHTSIGQIGNMMGPLVGGWAVQYIDTWAAIMINGVSYLLGIAFLFMMSRPAVTTRRGSSPISDFVGGFRHAIRTPMAAVLIFLSATFGFFGMAYMQVVPAFTTEFLRVNEFQTGVFMVFRGAGAFMGSMVVASWGHTKNKGLLMYLQLIICSLGLIAMGWVAVVLGGVLPGGAGRLHQHRRLLAGIQFADAVDHRAGYARANDGDDAVGAGFPLSRRVAADLAGTDLRLVDSHHQRGGGAAGHLGGGVDVPAHGAADERNLRPVR